MPEGKLDGALGTVGRGIRKLDTATHETRVEEEVAQLVLTAYLGDDGLHEHTIVRLVDECTSEHTCGMQCMVDTLPGWRADETRRIAQKVDTVSFEQDVASGWNEGAAPRLVLDTHLLGECPKASVEVGLAYIGTAAELGNVTAGRIPGVPDEAVLVVHRKRHTYARDSGLERENRVGCATGERLSYV